MTSRQPSDSTVERATGAGYALSELREEEDAAEVLQRVVALAHAWEDDDDQRLSPRTATRPPPRRAVPPAGRPAV